ncbi:MAG: hypothetical protein LBV65_03290 [Desulfovibrio sp.]|nr:hypothetical protein [Desulfovibrio sp.]
MKLSVKGRMVCLSRNAALRDLFDARLPALTTEERLDPSRVCERRKDHKSEEVWAMCGKFCSVKMVRGAVTAFLK